jgi:hypothetical protein
LELVNQNKQITQKFYWTDGTVLAEFYLKHRLSEDIDLFCENEEVDQKLVEAFLRKSKDQLNIREIKGSNFLGLFSYHLIYNDQESLKIDFNYYPFGRIQKGAKYRNIEIDSLYDIAVNKVHTIAMKPRARDFIDIFFIVKEKKYTFHDLMMQSKAKFDWDIDHIQLGSQLLKAQDVKDYPRMIKKIDNKKWQDFFVNEAKKLKKEIFL